ncbi:hypothetical protein EBO15_35975 [Actinomadura harenae]|uniref:Uncharacterized protein n=1 Tax=Actinomadura harenae TaxID=2483351 RepID=A0A3M2LMV7_9ACTN|nr:hypothetical protein EBO15_35975 [Actinomadura harenae]
MDALIATAETVLPGAGGAPGAVTGAGGTGAEEMECVLRWMDSPGVRLVEVEGEWTCPAYGAESFRGWIENAYAAVDPSDR